MTAPNLPRYQRMSIEAIPPFTETIELEFDDHVNLIIGPNGTGKSTILRLMDLNFPLAALPGYKPNAFRIGTKGAWPRNRDGSTDWLGIPHLYLPPIREVMPLSSTTRVFQLPLPERARQSWDGLMFQPNHQFDGSRLYHAMQRLYGEDLISTPRQLRAAEVAYRGYACIKDICNELISGDIPQNIRTIENLQGDNESGLGLPEGLAVQPIEHYAMGIDTTDDLGDALYVGELSTGTQGTFLWVTYLALVLARGHNFERGWHERAGILLIDEIENHLHPTWQRRVIPTLLKHFPGLQIFATTHSPFVVGGLKRGQVHKLFKDGKVIKTTNISEEEKAQEIVGWPVEDILREFMDVDDPTDEYTATAAATLRWLRVQRPSDADADVWRRELISDLEALEHPNRDELAALRWLQSHVALRGKAQQWWEDKLGELRSAVSRDIESRGSIAAQRELFLEQLSQILKEDDD